MLETKLAIYRRLKQQGRWKPLITQAAHERRRWLQGAYVAQPARQRLGMEILPTSKSQRPRCGAKTRAGGTCQATVVDGRNRCRLHGGLSTGPTSEAGRAAIGESNQRRAKHSRLASKKTAGEQGK